MQRIDLVTEFYIGELPVVRLDGVEGFDFSAPAKSITEGDVSVTFAGASDGAASAEARFDALLDKLIHPPNSILAAYRRLRW